MDKLPVVHEITDIHSYNDNVLFDFSNGYKAIFEGYYHGFGYQLEGLRHFSLYDGLDQLVCKYNSRLYRSGPQDNEHKIAYLDKRYSQQEVAEYWQSARNTAHNLFWNVDTPDADSNDKYWYPWRVTSEGWFDLERLAKGGAEFVEDRE